jgi:hypothetical protein
MRVLLYFQLVLAVLGSGLSWFLVAPMAGWSFAAGAGLTFLNFAVLVFAWPRILARKQFALAIVAIVSKFAILIWILYLVAHSPTVHLGWFAVGLATVIPSVLVTAFLMPASVGGVDVGVTSDEI